MRRPLEFWLFVMRGIAMILGSAAVIVIGGAVDLIRGRGEGPLRKGRVTSSFQPRT